MKNVLIIGESSYIGKSFAEYAKDSFNISTVGSRSGEWKAVDFSKYDSVLHCAGIAHVSQKKDMKALYYAVNCDLAAEVACAAKSAGVRQFVFLSSMLVYGKSDRQISIKTPPNPESFYGDSKLQAEKKLSLLADDDFKVCIIRPPMVYGRDCKGNFPRLVSLAKRTPLFPDIKNKRSMIYIENLCACIKHLIKTEKKGTYLPQNKKHVNTTDLVRVIAKIHGKKMRTTKLFNPLIKASAIFLPPVNKLFGDLAYAPSDFDKSYPQIDFEETIRRAIGKNK